MMTERDQSILQQFADKVRLHIPDAQIWVFGSRARGDAQPDSDMDICVVAGEMNAKHRNIVSYAAWEVGFENELFLQTLKYSREQFENSPRVSSPLLRAIRQEGILA
ncbi:MAG: nucleotidyltransferase domain-containing protein [Phormidesmis sp.]